MNEDATLIEVTAPWALDSGSHAAESVRTWWQRAEQVYPANTLKAWRADWAVYVRYCTEVGASPLPAEPASVAAFVAASRDAGRKPATVKG